MIPRVGEPVRSNKSYTHRPGVYAVLERGGLVLLTFQGAPVPEVQLPGGGIDGNEQPLAALHREIVEETGWRVSGLRRIGAFRRFTYMPEYELWAEKLCHVYHGRPSLNTGSPIEDHHTPIWATPYEAIQLVGNEGDRLFLRRLYS